MGLLRDTDLGYLLLNYSVLGESDILVNSILLSIEYLWKDYYFFNSNVIDCPQGEELSVWAKVGDAFCIFGSG